MGRPEARQAGRLIRTALVTVAAALLIAAPTASAAPAWAPAGSAAIHPGVMTFTEGSGQCTANFVFFDATDVYIGQAAHCSGTGAATETDGCLAETLPVGTEVDIGGSRPGTMVYNSWATMQANGERDPDTCAYNDFALIRVDPADVDDVNPSIPFWGGPTGVTATVPARAKALSYGNSSLRLGVTQLSPKQGLHLRQDAGGWNHQVYTVSPGIPGDSGSAFIDAQGRAFGTLSTVHVAPEPGSNGVGNVVRELDYMRSNSAFGGVELANGTTPFRGPLL